MKKCILAALLCSGSAVAATGNTFISHLNSVTHNASSQTESYVYLTNTSAYLTTVTIQMYNSDGSRLKDHENNNNSTTGLIKASNVYDYDEQSDNYTVRFKLEPNKTTRVWLDNLTNQEIIAYGHVEWSNADTNLSNKALLGHAMFYRSYNGVGYSAIPINGGQPF